MSSANNQLQAFRGSSVLDDLLLKAAADGRSPMEMERLSGIPAAQAVQHVKQLLESRDVWTEHQQRQLLLNELHELKDSLREQALKAKDLDSARLLLKSLEVIGKRLDSQQQTLDENVIKLSNYQQSVLLRAMNTALDFAKKQLAERYPNISHTELDELVADGLVQAKYEIMADEDDSSL
jgi:DNA helicase HerA-like ATPase